MKRTHRSYFRQTLLLGCVAIRHYWLSYEALILIYSFSCFTMPDSWMDGYLGKFKDYTANDRYFWSSHQVVGSHMWLPSFHALNGCDYTASFLRKAKWKPYQIIKANSRFTTAIGHLGDSDVLDLDGMVTVEEYICYECAISAVSMMPDFNFSESFMPMPPRMNQTYWKRSKHQIFAAYHLANGFFSRSC